MKIRVRVPEGTALDAAALAKAIGEAIQAQGRDASKIWRLNDVPAIAQLEEAVYGPGAQELGEIFDQVARRLALPADPALFGLGKGVRQPAAGQLGLGFEDGEPETTARAPRVPRVKQEGGPAQSSLDFDEEAHPRLGAGEA